MEDKEALQTSAVISDVSDLVQDLVDKLLSDSVMTTSVVVGCIFLSSDHLLRVEQASVGASADFIDDIGLEITVDCAWYVFPVTCEGTSQRCYSAVLSGEENCLPVSEKKVLKPWSGSAALRSSVRYPSGCVVKSVRALELGSAEGKEGLTWMPCSRQ